MPPTKNEPEKRRSSSDAALAALLALAVDNREREIADQRDAVKTEVLLSRAGVPAEEIATLTGKSVDAVRKTLQRARTK